MAESSVGVRPPAEPAHHFFSVPRERPKVVVAADILPAVSVLSMVMLTGIPLAALWALLAPPQRVRVVSATENPVPLQLESWHRFDDLAVFALLAFGVGIVVGVVIWLLRERRGPVVLLAAVLGSVLAWWLASMLGPGAFAGMLYEVTAAPQVGDVLETAPVLESAWVLLAQPLAVAATYGLLAGWNGRDDLGRRLG
ncbi:DUF2567 domain-containing protein [Amycolatopsis magusensis]|uniref:DUF2567 domain-containing protein n=1 Tax=Amycolatopsis magusensis TaxID=882444 RepID=UPI0037A14F61